MTEEREQYQIMRPNGTAVAPWQEDQMAGMIEALYPGTTPIVKRAAVVLGLKYNLDPILKEILIIELGSENVGGKWEKKYGVYIGQDGMETVANRSGIRWTIRLSQPKPMKNPYTKEDDIWLEGTLYREGYQPLTDGRWFSEVCRTKGDGTPMYNWKIRPSEMHRKAVRLYLLRRGFSINGEHLASVDTFVEEPDTEPLDYIDQFREPAELIKFIEERVAFHYRAGHSGPIGAQEKAYLDAAFYVLHNHEALVQRALMKRTGALEREDALAIIDWLRGSPDPQGELQALVEWDGSLNGGNGNHQQDIDDVFGGEAKNGNGKKLAPADEIRKRFGEAGTGKDVPPSDADFKAMLSRIEGLKIDAEKLATFLFNTPPGGLSEAHVRAIMSASDEQLKKVLV